MRAIPPNEAPSIPVREILLCCWPSSCSITPLSNRLPKNPRYKLRFSVPVRISARVDAVVLRVRTVRRWTRSSPAERSMFTSSSDHIGTIAKSVMPPLRTLMASSSTPSRNTRTRPGSPYHAATCGARINPVRIKFTPGTVASRSPRVSAPLAYIASRSQCQLAAPISVDAGA